jgi:hypothetical protein
VARTEFFETADYQVNTNYGFCVSDCAGLGQDLEYRRCDFGDQTYNLVSRDPLFQSPTKVSLASDQLTFRVNVLLGKMGR